MILDVLIHQLEKLRDAYGGDLEVRVAPTDGQTWPKDNYMTREAFLFAGRDLEEEYVCLDYDPLSNRVGITKEDRFRDLAFD